MTFNNFIATQPGVSFWTAVVYGSKAVADLTGWAAASSEPVNVLFDVQSTWCNISKQVTTNLNVY